MCAHTHVHMSPAQAAQAAGVSRWTIMRAIKAHKLQATRDNRNQWKIAAEDLDRWRLHSVRTPEAVHTLHTHEVVTELRERLATETARANAAEAMLSREQEVLKDALIDRDRWYDAYREATRKGDPILPVAFTVLFTASLAALANGMTMKDSLIGWLSIILGGVLLVMSIAIADRIRRQHEPKDVGK